MRPKLQYLSTGDAVVELQTKLNVLLPAALPPLEVDGIFGDMTLARVKQFQTTRGLIRDGVVGAKTWAAIDGQTPPESPPPEPGTPATPDLPGWDLFFPLVCSGDMVFCTHGTETRGIKVSPPNRPANVLDNKAITNIPPFGGCLSLDNPAVRKANEAFQDAQGPLGPLYKPWEPGEKKKYGHGPVPAACSPLLLSAWKGAKRLEKVGTPPQRVLDRTCRLGCSWGGVIKFVT
jgi:peptidoglycan hydrolase-like protein with peptidoglycan-binding domain